MCNAWHYILHVREQALWLAFLQLKEDSKLETSRAITIVETIVHSFSERKLVITEYYEFWQVHVTSGREFKSQWHQFVQDARKVGTNQCVGMMWIQGLS